MGTISGGNGEVWEPTADELSMITYSQLLSSKGDDVNPAIRTMNFKKKEEDTNLRILYFDNLRVATAGWCRWEIKVDGKSCRTPLAGTVHSATGENDHHPGTVVGECGGVSAGDHVLTVALTSNTMTGINCHTGWETHVVLEVQEGGIDTTTPAPTHEPYAELEATRVTKPGKDDRDKGLLDDRVLDFTKLEDDTVMRLTYADNFRVYGHGKTCRWNVLIDGKDCAIPIMNGKHNWHSGNDHEPHAVTGTCPGLAKGAHKMTVYLADNNSGDCSTGWDANSSKDAFFLEAVELKPEYPMMSYKMFSGSSQSADTGLVPGRVFDFEKVHAATDVRVTWSTNLRVKNDAASSHCSWEILIDGKSCASPTKLWVRMHSNKNENDHIPMEMVGWCKNLAAGRHVLTVKVEKTQSSSDCHTGWNTNEYMEVWEPTADELSMITYSQLLSSKGDDVNPAIRTMNFKKKEEDTNLRILYFDNLRVATAGWCRWELKVDGESCPTPLAGSVHTATGENDHHPGTVMGECPGVKAGDHALTVALTSMAAGINCHTGWETHVVMEVREIVEE
eukprot:TRINITY_DN40_c0_g1_i1.p1 TRINITY_DN40_c0_g1~~TRINITY_DN40_c0_g1_i1.p1  ORF type:complete len:562 (-),score=131.71 TRINITY_DN40_c0_g1_i1:146-1831(-)